MTALLVLTAVLTLPAVWVAGWHVGYGEGLKDGYDIGLVEGRRSERLRADEAELLKLKAQ